MPSVAESNPVRAFYERDGEEVSIDLNFRAPIHCPADDFVDVVGRMQENGLSADLIISTLRGWADDHSTIEQVSVVVVDGEYWIVTWLNQAQYDFDIPMRSQLNSIRSYFEPFSTDTCFVGPESTDDDVSRIPGLFVVYKRGAQ